MGYSSRVRSWPRGWGTAILLLALALPGSAALAANGDCGIPLTSGTEPKANDCLFILRAGVGAETCAACVCDTNGNLEVSATDALVCLGAAVGQDLALQCPDCPVTTTLPETTTTTLPLADGCPDVVQWETRGQRSSACTTNDDCAGGDCDAAIGLCRTATDYDLGWTGYGHDGDLNEGSRLRVRVDCDAADAPCGECSVEGIDPSAGNCRCSNNTRARCDEPFAPDADDCPACAGGFRVDGITCGANADCQLAPCARRCANNAAVCSSNTDCPGSTCGNPARCQNNTAVTCTTNTDCLGSTCLPAVTTCGNRLSCTANADCTGTCAAASDCECFDGPPVPLSIGGTPLCFVHRLAADVGGTVDVDSGASSLAVSMRVRVYLGSTTTSPCPVCGGRCTDTGGLCATEEDCEQGGTCTLDPEAGDGNAGGFCVGGRSNGLSCDVDAANTSFPARPGERGGAGHSLDCFPDVGKNVTGQGLAVHLVESTGSGELAAEVSCGGAYSAFSCPCLVCSGDPGVACNSHEECAGLEGNCSLAATLRCLSNSDCQDLDVGPCITVGAQKRCSKKTSKICLSDEECTGQTAGDCNPSMCSSSSNGMSAPNQCDDLQCSDIGDGTGECTTGPDTLFCNGVVKANGDGVLACTKHEDCLQGMIFIDDPGECTLSRRSPCFLDTIDASGSAHPSRPVTAAAFCTPPTSGGGVNAVIGLPGPARIRRQSTLLSWCGSDPGNVYTPGSGGCVP